MSVQLCDLSHTVTLPHPTMDRRILIIFVLPVLWLVEPPGSPSPVPATWSLKPTDEGVGPPESLAASPVGGPK